MSERSASAGRRAGRLIGTWLLIAGLTAGLALTGCGSGAQHSASKAGSAAQRPAGTGDAVQNPQNPAPQNPNDQKPNQATGGGAPAQVPAKLTPEDRAIIFTGSINVRVSDVDAKATEATSLAIAAGGFVGGDNRTVNGSHSEARLILRVPSAKFTETVTALGHLGTEENRSLSTQDVTTDVVDLDARIASAQASVERVRALLAKAQNLGEVVSLEAEVSRRESDLESLKARQRKFADLAALSTITAALLGKEAASSPAAAAKPADTGFVAGLKGSWRTLLGSLTVLLTVVGALLPWVLAFGVPIGVVVWLLRRRLGHQPTAVALPVPAPQGQAPQPTTEPSRSG